MAEDPPPVREVRWRQFGRAEQLDLRGTNRDTPITLPVPEGVTATSVAGQIGSVVNVAAGRVDVLDGRGNALGTIPVPVDTPTAPFQFDTSRAAVDDGVLTLNFVLRVPNPPSDTCAPTPSVRLIGLTTAMVGQPPSPTTVADYLPRYLDAVTIATGPDPTPDQQQAALTLTAMLTRNYRPTPLRVDVDTSGTVMADDSSGRRVIVIRDSEEPGIEVRDPGTPQAVLVISGRGAALANQIALFIDRRLALAQTPSATVTSATGALTPTSSIMTFEKLGMAVSTSFTGSTTVYAGFDGAAFAAGPIEAAAVNLRARYTPTAGDTASVLIKSGSYVVASRRLDQSGALDLRFDLPPQTIASDIGMALELQYVPGGGNGGGCAPLTDRMTFALDPQSTVEVNPGEAGAGGFTSLPAGFTPEFAVAVDRPDLIRFAAQAVNLIGQRTGTLLRPQIANLDEAARTETALLAVTADRGVGRLGMNPPVQSDGGGRVAVDGTVGAEALLGGPLGLVQSFTENGRTVLAVDVPDKPELADATFDYIRGLENGWSSLSGDVVATGSAGDTVNLTIRADRPVPGRTAAKSGWKWAGLATAGIAVATALAVARGMIGRRSRNRD